MYNDAYVDIVMVVIFDHSIVKIYYIISIRVHNCFGGGSETKMITRLEVLLLSDSVSSNAILILNAFVNASILYLA